jgi:hypothetical protein
MKEKNKALPLMPTQAESKTVLMQYLLNKNETLFCGNGKG